MPLAPFLMPGSIKRNIRPYLHKNSVVIEGLTRCKIVYFGDDGIAVNVSPLKLFGMTIHHTESSKYFSFGNVKSVNIVRNGIKNKLLINGSAVFTWCTIGKNSYSYEKMNKLVNVVKRRLKIIQINS